MLQRSLALLLLASLVASSKVTSPALDLLPLGHVIVAGSFSGLSLYENTAQTQPLTIAATNGTGGDSLYQDLGNGVYTNLGTSDGKISAMCILSGNSAGGKIYIGGKFGTIGGVSAKNIASYDPVSSTFSALADGLPGTVNTLLCQNRTNQVYVGGIFRTSNSSNTVIWQPSISAFVDVPFGGFDGPVNAIVERSNSILFGGGFDSTSNGNGGSASRPQAINLQSANVVASFSTAAAEFSNPQNIVCPTEVDAPGGTWLLSDNQLGTWTAALNFTIRPTKLRLRNTHVAGRGTAGFRFVSQPSNGIMNLTYTNPSGSLAACDAICPLSSSISVGFQEFDFVNVIGMSGFTIEIFSWYGLGGGLSGIELLQDDINVYAVNSFNQPPCANETYPSRSSAVGSWTQVQMKNQSGYIACDLSGSALSTSSVLFEPTISQRGNYSVRVYTPGCDQDASCKSRGAVVMSIYSNPNEAPVNTTIFQTNLNDKYDTIYQGILSQASATFRPTVILSAANGQSGSLHVVASRVQFVEMNSVGSAGLNGLYEFTPSTFDASVAPNSTFDQVGRSLNYDATIKQIVISGQGVIVGGNFSGTNTSLNNILLSQPTGPVPVGETGQGGSVNAIIEYKDILFVGGNMTSIPNSIIGANHFVGYNMTSKSWISLEGGVNGPVDYVFEKNGSIEISGPFTELHYANNQTVKAANGIAFWDPVLGTWANQVEQLEGRIAGLSFYNASSYIIGSLRSAHQLGVASVAALVSSSSSQRLTPLRSTLADNAKQLPSVFTGSLYNSSSKSLTILAGSFNTTDSANKTISNVALISPNGTTNGLPMSNLSPANVYRASYVLNDKLFLGGIVAGSIGTTTVGGIVMYDLAASNFASDQPAALQGSNVQVNAINSRPGTQQLVVAGSFDTAGILVCPAFCVLDSTSLTWQRPTTGLQGNVTVINWSGQNTLLLGGDLLVNNTQANLLSFDFNTQQLSTLPGLQVPGTPAAFAIASTGDLFITGRSNAETYLAKYNGTTTLLDAGLGPNSSVNILQFVKLSKARSVSSPIPADQDLLLLGNINLTNSGQVSGALFDGRTSTPYLLSSTSEGSDGTIYTLISEQTNTFGKIGRRLARGYVLLISLAIAVFLVLLVTAVGLIAAWYRRRQEGYRPAPSDVPEKSFGRIPPSNLFAAQNFQNPTQSAVRI